MTLTIVLMGYSFVQNIRYFYLHGKGTIYCICFGMVVLHLIVLSELCGEGEGEDGDKKTHFHMHHHYWAFLLSLLFRCRYESSVAAHALLVAIFIHGISVFGCEPLVTLRNV